MWHLDTKWINQRTGEASILTSRWLRGDSPVSAGVITDHRWTLKRKWIKRSYLCKCNYTWTLFKRMSGFKVNILSLDTHLDTLDYLHLNGECLWLMWHIINGNANCVHRSSENMDRAKWYIKLSPNVQWWTQKYLHCFCHTLALVTGG